MTHSTVDQQYYFELPCTTSMQGDLLVIMLSVPFRMLKRFVAVNNTGHVLDRSQRELNPMRVKKLVSYLLDAHQKRQPFIIPPLIANSDQHIAVEHFGRASVGMARVPMDAELDFFDGQHRCAAIIEYARHIDDGSAVMVMLTQQLSLAQRQQFFADINNTASKPSATISMAYNGRDQLTSELMTLFSTHPVFREITDFEHNTVPASSHYLVSFKPLCDATARFVSAGDASMSSAQIMAVWDAWLELAAVSVVRGIRLTDYRKDYIQFYSVMLNAFGLAVQQLREDNSPGEIVKAIQGLTESTDSALREEFFRISNWLDYCVVRSGNKLKIQADVSAQRRAGTRMANAFRSRNLTGAQER